MVNLEWLRYGHALTIAVDYLVDDEVKVIWKGNVSAENTLYLVYRTRVTTDLVALMKQFTGGIVFLLGAVPG